MNIFSKEKLNDSLSLSGECDAYSPKTASQINLTRGQWFKYDKSL